MNILNLDLMSIATQGQFGDFGGIGLPDGFYFITLENINTPSGGTGSSSSGGGFGTVGAAKPLPVIPIIPVKEIKLSVFNLNNELIFSKVAQVDEALSATIKEIERKTIPGEKPKVFIKAGKISIDSI